MERQRVNRLRDMNDESVVRDYSRTMGRMVVRYTDLAGQVARLAPDARRVLDLATGPGVLLPALAKRLPKAEIVGLDLSPVMLGAARTRLVEEGLSDRVELVEASAMETGFETGEFDIVVTSEFLHMLDDLVPLFVEVKRILAPAGHFMAFDHRRDLGWVAYRAMWLTTWFLERRGYRLDGMGPVIDACWTKPEVEAALAEGGFRSFEVNTGLTELAVHAERG
jgi:ubiquinone/menaquinone biosynthesis C-methylase UbiE